MKFSDKLKDEKSFFLKIKTIYAEGSLNSAAKEFHKENKPKSRAHTAINTMDVKGDKRKHVLVPLN